MLNPMTHRKILRKGVPGEATIVEMGALDWEGVRANYEREKAARREALANGQPGGIDAGSLAQAEQALSAMGINVDLSDAVVTYGAPPPEQDDAISKLERLAALHASGAHRRGVRRAEAAGARRWVVGPLVTLQPKDRPLATAGKDAGRAQ